MRGKRLLSAVLAGAMLVSTGCGAKNSGAGEANSPATTAAAAAPAGAEKASEGAQNPPAVPLADQITVAMAMNESEWEVMNQKIFKNFEAKTGIKVNGLQIEYADMEGKIQSLHEAGKAEIDVVCPDNMLLAGMVKKELIKDMSEFESLIPEEISKNLYEGFKFDEKLYYFPSRANAKINFYNETKFDQYGLTPPTNWEELEHVIKTFAEKEGVGRYAIQGNMGAPTTVSVFEFILSAGGDPLVLNDEGSVEAFTFLQKIWPYISAETKRANPNLINQILANETVYYADNWPVAATVIVKEGGKTEIKAHTGFEGPKGVGKVLGGSVMAVTSVTQKDVEARMFIEYMMSLEAQEIFCSEIGWAPIREDAIAKMEDWQKPYFEAVMESLAVAQPRPVVAYWSDVDKAINEAFKEIVIEQNSDVKGILDRGHADIEAARVAAE